MPNIVTDRLILRPLEITDSVYMEYYLDESILKFATLYMPHKKEDLEIHASRIKGIATFAVELKDGTFIGDVGVTSIVDNQTGEIAWYFNPIYWKKGYATEACKAVIQYVFDELHLKNITAQIDETNIDSRRLAERLGFKLVKIENNIELYGVITNRCDYIYLKI